MFLKVGQRRQHKGEVDAETTPLRDPEHYMYDFNLPDVTEVWRRGSVIASWLLDLTASALLEDPQLAKFAGRGLRLGEGDGQSRRALTKVCRRRCWTTALYEALQLPRPCPTSPTSVLSAMRYEFGGTWRRRRESRHNERRKSFLMSTRWPGAGAAVIAVDARAAWPRAAAS